MNPPAGSGANQAPPRKKSQSSGPPERIRELSREILVDPETGAVDRAIVVQSVDNPKPSVGVEPVRSNKALRVHVLSPNKHTPKKRPVDHMVLTGYLREEPDLHRLARAISFTAEQLYADRRKEQETDDTPPAKAA